MQLDISSLVCLLICLTTANKEKWEKFSAENKEKKGKVFSRLDISISYCVISKHDCLYFSANTNNGKKGQEF